MIKASVIAAFYNKIEYLKLVVAGFERQSRKDFELIIETATQKREYQYTGRTYMDAPEIDGITYVKSNRVLNPGDIINVKITDCSEYDTFAYDYHTMERC